MAKYLTIWLASFYGGFGYLKTINGSEESKEEFTSFKTEFLKYIETVFYYPETADEPNFTKPGRVYSPLYVDGYNPTGADLISIQSARKAFKRGFKLLRKSNPELYNRLEINKVKQIIKSFTKELKKAANNPKV